MAAIVTPHAILDDLLAIDCQTCYVGAFKVYYVMFGCVSVRCSDGLITSPVYANQNILVDFNYISLFLANKACRYSLLKTTVHMIGDLRKRHFHTLALSEHLHIDKTLFLVHLQLKRFAYDVLTQDVCRK